MTTPRTSRGPVLCESLEGRTLLSAAFIGPKFVEMGAPAATTTTPTIPDKDLPWNISRITGTGGRPVYSPDGTHIAYVQSIIGDCFEVDLKTGISTNLTAKWNLHSFTRVHYLPDGNYLLIGSRTPDTVATLDADQELFVLKADGKSAPVPLGAKCYDGVGVSRISNTIAWGTNDLLYPGRYPAKASALNVATVGYSNGVPVLVNSRVVLTRPNTWVNGQDFRNNDSEVIFADYLGPIASVRGINLKTGVLTTYRSFTGEYNEAEGVSPDGTYELVESSRDKGVGHQTAQYIDIWKMPLQANTTHFRRMTRFGDLGPFKASNPVISPDGRYYAFQVSVIGTQAGTGNGIFVLDTLASPPTTKTVAQEFLPNTTTGFVSAPSGTTPAATAKFSNGAPIVSNSSTAHASAITFTRSFQTNGFSKVSLLLSASQSSGKFGASDFLEIEVNDGQGWQRIMTDAGYYQAMDDATPESTTPLAGNTTPTWTAALPLPVGVAAHGSVQVRITCQVGTAGEQYKIGPLKLIGFPIGK